MKNLLILFVVPMLLLCNFLPVQNSDSTGMGFAKSDPQIVYLFFKVEKTESGSEKIILQEKKITDGKLKSVPAYDESLLKTGDLVVSLTDINGKSLVKQVVEDPLNPVMEVYENGISRNKVTLQAAEFSVRYPASGAIRIVSIEKVTVDGPQLLFTQRLY